MITASYTRKSVKFGDAIPIAEQNAMIEQFAKSHRMSITKRYSDRKEGADAEDGFLEMKEDGLCRKYDCIIIWSVMYFGKEPLIGYNLLRHTFLPAGIDFAVVSDGFISIGRTTEEIVKYLEMKYKERRKAHGLAVAALGRERRANTLYGYKLVDGEFFIDEKVKQTVEKVFSLALAGKTPKEICQWLNERNIEPPQIYLKKEAGRSIDGVSELWGVLSVKKILSDSRYKGIQRVTHAGTEEFLPFPAYIDESTYDKLNGHKAMCQRAERWDNPLLKKVLDKDTGIRMYSGDYMSDGKRYFYISNLTEEARQYKKKAILANEVLACVEAAMNREHRIALRVLKLIESDTEHTAFQEQTRGYRKELEKVFEQMLFSADGGDLDELQMLDRRFSKLQKTMNLFQTAYSLQNPWLKLYLTMEEHEPLCKENTKRFIDKVLIEKNERIELVPYHSEYKDCLPKNWTEVEE